ncbi:MAG TPA: DRTGG domain-containing protein [Aggregatilineales bacterium]|mgnify:CR=1 FL=1|nr:DRTGG domain-containing protein [Aggregatilineales bacterium]
MDEKSALQQEWMTLQGQYERYESGGLGIKLAAVVLAFLGVVFELESWFVGLIVLLLWLQEGVFKTFQSRLGDRLLGVVLNRVPDTELEFVEKEAVPFLESKGIPVLGTIVERPELAAISVGELIDVLDARPITKAVSENALVENLMVGAMSAQEALSRFRQIQNKAVITGGDRTDVQLAALETSTTALILTGNLQPSAAVIERAEQLGVTVLLVSTNTLETVEAIEGVFGKTRLGQAAKLARFEALMAEYMDYQRLFKLLNLESSAE